MKTIKLKDILSISGKGGLFKFIAQARNGIVVESIEDNKRHVAPATARVSSLEDIAIFTHEEELPLADIFMLIHDRSEGKETISHKVSADELKKLFEELVPEYDDERVYISDIKKVFQWYNQLHGHGMLEVIDKEEEGEDASVEEPAEKREEKDSSEKDTSKMDAPKKDAPNKETPEEKSGETPK